MKLLAKLPNHGALDADAPTVLFVAGLGRSGSTLLGRILGSQPACVDIGELGHMWKAGLVEDRECSCGEPFSRCGFWQKIGQEAFGGWDQIDVAHIRRLQASVDRIRYLPLMVLPWLNPAYRRRMRRYAGFLADFYSAVATAHGDAVPVDTTKNISTAFLLARSPAVDLRLIHLVRDCRGVAYSWTKLRAKRPGDDDGPLMDTYSPAVVAIRYLGYNAALGLLRAVTPASRLLVYERAMADPRGELAQVLALADRRLADDGRLDDDGVTLAQTHSLGGNPMRYQTGRIPLRIDTAWRSGLTRRDRLTVTVIAWPMLWRYGYLRP